MANRPRRTKGVQTGARSRRVVQSVRRATLEELARVGYAQMTIGSVAEAAGVNRTTIYRRWATKPALVESLLEPQFARLDRVPPTGTLEDHLSSLLHAVAENLATVEGQAVVGLLGSTLPELAEIAAEARRRAMAAFERAFALARERGELPDDADVDVLLHLAFFGGMEWVMQHEPPVAEPDCRRLVRVVLAGLSRGRDPEPGDLR